MTSYLTITHAAQPNAKHVVKGMLRGGLTMRTVVSRRLQTGIARYLHEAARFFVSAEDDNTLYVAARCAGAACARDDALKWRSRKVYQKLRPRRASGQEVAQDVNNAGSAGRKSSSARPSGLSAHENTSNSSGRNSGAIPISLSRTVSSIAI